MTSSTPETIIENTIKLHVGMNHVIMIGRLDAELPELDQGLPLAGNSPPFVPNRVSVAGHDVRKEQKKK